MTARRHLSFWFLVTAAGLAYMFLTWYDPWEDPETFHRFSLEGVTKEGLQVQLSYVFSCKAVHRRHSGGTNTRHAISPENQAVAIGDGRGMVVRSPRPCPRANQRFGQVPSGISIVNAYPQVMTVDGGGYWLHLTNESVVPGIFASLTWSIESVGRAEFTADEILPAKKIPSRCYAVAVLPIEHPEQMLPAEWPDDGAVRKAPRLDRGAIGYLVRETLGHGKNVRPPSRFLTAPAERLYYIFPRFLGEFSEEDVIAQMDKGGIATCVDIYETERSRFIYQDLVIGNSKAMAPFDIHIER